MITVYSKIVEVTRTVRYVAFWIVNAIRLAVSMITDEPDLVWQKKTVQESKTSCSKR